MSPLHEDVLDDDDNAELGIERDPPLEVQLPVRGALLWSLVEDSLDEAEFLWTRWHVLQDSHRHDLGQVAFWAEERLLGALDGVKVAGDSGLDHLFESALISGIPARIACAACIAASLDSPRARALVARALTSFVGVELTAVCSGLALAERIDLAGLAALVDDAAPALQAALLQLFATQRFDPGPRLEALGSSSDARVRAAALACSAAAGAAHAASAVARGLADPVPSVAMSAIKAGLVLGDAQAWAVCRAGPPAAGADAAWADLLPLLAACGARDALEGVKTALQQPTLRREALLALAFSGTRDAAALTLELMSGGRAALAHVAAASFAFITGSKLGSVEEPEPPVPTLEDDDLDADLTPDRDAELPLLDASEAVSFWRAHVDRFRPETRYVHGVPLTAAGMLDLLESGASRWRHGVAAELAVRSRGSISVATRGWSRRQRMQLARARQLDVQPWAAPPLSGWRRLATRGAHGDR
jgi:uncharacterized protein (TIGR02270 family)